MLEGFFDIIAFIAFAFVAAASYTDIRTREVPDLLNYGLAFLAAALRVIYSISSQDYMIMIEGVLGGALGLGVGAAMYYTRQWGGGDTKLLAGLGILIGLPLKLELGFLPMFVINIFFAGAAYALFLALFSAGRNWKSFLREARGINESMKRAKIAVLVCLVIIMASSFFIDDPYLRLMLFTLSVLMIVLLYTYIFVRSVERSAMLKEYQVSRLTEGDWIAKDVYAGSGSNKRLICGPKDLGITSAKIALLKKHGVKKVLVKEGIPFVPSFLIAFILTYYLGNWISLVI